MWVANILALSVGNHLKQSLYCLGSSFSHLESHHPFLFISLISQCFSCWLSEQKTWPALVVVTCSEGTILNSGGYWHLTQRVGSSPEHPLPKSFATVMVTCVLLCHHLLLPSSSDCHLTSGYWEQGREERNFIGLLWGNSLSFYKWQLEYC